MSPAIVIVAEELSISIVEAEDKVTPLFESIVKLLDPVTSKVPPFKLILLASAVPGTLPKFLSAEIDKVPDLISTPAS